MGTAFLIEGCCVDPPQPFEYKVRGFELVNFDLNTTSEIAQDSIPLRVSNYGIYFKSITERIAQNKAQGRWFSSSAFAARCNLEREYIAKQKVVAVDFITLNDFDEDHPKNSSVINLFEGFLLKESCVKAGGSFESCSGATASFNTEKDLITVLNDEFIFNDFLNVQSLNRNRLNLLKLKAFPTSPYQQFVIKVTTDDGQVFSDTTSVIKLNP